MTEEHRCCFSARFLFPGHSFGSIAYFRYLAERIFRSGSYLSAGPSVLKDSFGSIADFSHLAERIFRAGVCFFEAFAKNF